jgi:hypothetical protein
MCVCVSVFDIYMEKSCGKECLFFCALVCHVWVVLGTVNICAVMTAFEGVRMCVDVNAMIRVGL